MICNSCLEKHYGRRVTRSQRGALLRDLVSCLWKPACWRLEIPWKRFLTQRTQRAQSSERETQRNRCRPCKSWLFFSKPFSVSSMLRAFCIRKSQTAVHRREAVEASKATQITIRDSGNMPLVGMAGPMRRIHLLSLTGFAQSRILIFWLFGETMPARRRSKTYVFEMRPPRLHVRF